MQTFLPYPNFEKSVKVLDNKRLGRQRAEVLTLLRGKWLHHPASRMWRGHEYQLAEYGLAVCREWKKRGYKDNTAVKIKAEQKKFRNTGFPKWFGKRAFHRAHKSNLLRKNRLHYKKYFPAISDNLPYIWPV